MKEGQNEAKLLKQDVFKIRTKPCPVKPGEPTKQDLQLECTPSRRPLRRICQAMFGFSGVLAMWGAVLGPPMVFHLLNFELRCGFGFLNVYLEYYLKTFFFLWAWNVLGCLWKLLFGLMESAPWLNVMIWGCPIGSSALNISLTIGHHHYCFFSLDTGYLP